jgi:hypothetical protein
MNIDVLKDNQGWYWYLLFAVLTLGTNQIIHQYLQEQVKYRFEVALVSMLRD